MKSLKVPAREFPRYVSRNVYYLTFTKLFHKAIITFNFKRRKKPLRVEILWEDFKKR